MTFSSPFTATRNPDGPPWLTLARGDRTAGQVAFGEAVLSPQSSGPGLHVHTREDEAIYIIEGVLTVHQGGKTHEAGAGTLVWLPRNEPHTTWIPPHLIRECLESNNGR